MFSGGTKVTMLGSDFNLFAEARISVTVIITRHYGTHTTSSEPYSTSEVTV